MKCRSLNLYGDKFTLLALQLIINYFRTIKCPVHAATKSEYFFICPPISLFRELTGVYCVLFPRVRELELSAKYSELEKKLRELTEKDGKNVLFCLVYVVIRFSPVSEIFKLTVHFDADFLVCHQFFLQSSSPQVTGTGPGTGPPVDFKGICNMCVH